MSIYIEVVECNDFAIVVDVMYILIHTSKTMRPATDASLSAEAPLLLNQAQELNKYLCTLSWQEIKKVMQVSEALAKKTHEQISNWTTDVSWQRPAIDSFLGDIYSGIQIDSWSKADREYAQQTLGILSGLYGILRPLDGICPYRLEMGYRLPHSSYQNLYTFWDDTIARTLPKNGPIVNLAAVEYSKTVTPFMDESRIVSPRFLTVSPKTGEPTFVVVHAKIARGAYARWLIQKRIADITDLPTFSDIGYSYNTVLSTPDIPTYVCQKFGGIGLSMRLK